MMQHEVGSARAELCDAEPDYTSPYYEVLSIPLTPTTTYQQAYDALVVKFHETMDGWFDMGGAGSIVEDALCAAIVGGNAVMPQAERGDTVLWVGLIPEKDED